MILTGLASCAEDTSEQPSTESPATEVPATETIDTSDTTADTAVVAEGISVPTGADDVVVKIERGLGGFRTFQSTFAGVPALLITGDGRVFSEGPVPAIFPGPFLPNIQVAKIDPALLVELMGDAAGAGLLDQIPDYTVGQPGVTDVGSTALTLVANGRTYVHDAYALGMEQPEQGDAPARKALNGFIESATAKVATATSTVNSERFIPTTYLLATQPSEISPDTTTDPASGEPQPRLQLWPGEIGVDLKDLKCAPVDAAKVQELFEKADQLTFFFQDSGIYSLAVRPMLPGQPGCDSLK